MLAIDDIHGPRITFEPSDARLSDCRHATLCQDVYVLDFGIGASSEF